MELLPELQFTVLDFFSVNDLVELHLQAKNEYSSLLNNNNYLAQRLYKEINYPIKDFQRTYLYYHGKMTALEIFIKEYTKSGQITFGSEKFDDNKTKLLIKSIQQQDLKLTQYFYSLIKEKDQQNINKTIRSACFVDFVFVLTPEIYLFLLQQNKDKTDDQTVEIYCNLFLNFSLKQQNYLKSQASNINLFSQEILELI